MPYSSVWNVTDPAGSVAAKNIDDHIRKLRLQLQERFEDALVVSAAADPWVLKPTVSGTQVDLYRLIPFAAFLNNLEAKENNISIGGQMDGFSGAGPWIAPVDIPPGCVITLVEYLVDKHDTSGVTCELKSRVFGNAPAAAVSHSNILCADLGAKVYPSAALNLTIDAGRYYFLCLQGGGVGGNSFNIFGARIKFNRPSIASAT
jgi:hypothetical protein